MAPVVDCYRVMYSYVVDRGQQRLQPLPQPQGRQDADYIPALAKVCSIDLNARDPAPLRRRWRFRVRRPT
jgi:hypothetical protein